MMKSKTKFKQTEIGIIPKDWEVSTLEQIAQKITDGSHFSPKELSTGNRIIATVKDMGYNEFSFDDCKKISEDDFIQLVKNGCSPEKNDIIISKDGANCLDLIFVYNEDKKIVLLSSVAIVRLKDNFDPQFYRYYLLSPQAQKIMRDGYVSGSAIPRVILKNFKKIPIPNPHLEIQRKIGTVLWGLDKKIELNLKMNKTLEAIGQTIFHHWFVDFEFPNKEGKPYRSSGGEMVYNEELKKEIPKGWRVGKLSDFISVERGLSYKGSGLCNEGIPMINLGNIAPNNHFRYNGLKFYSGDFKERNLVNPGDLIIANTDITQKREVLGSCLIIPSDLGHDKILFTHHIYAIRHRNEKEILPKHFLSYLFQSHQYRERVTGFATGTTVLALPKDAILNFCFAVPDGVLMNNFDRIIRSVKNKNSNNIIENKNLSQIRDSLLPKLMSGKIRVPMEIKK